MADLSEQTSSGSTKLTGAGPSTGGETFYVDVDTNGSMKVVNKDDTGTTILMATSTLQSAGNATLVTIESDLGTINANLTNGNAKVQITSPLGTAYPSTAASAVLVRPIIPEPITYSAAASGFTFAAAPTDVFTLTGSGTKTVRVKRIALYLSATNAAPVTVDIVKRSTANSAGTSTTQTAVPHDSTSAAATATAKSYTANPTLGTLVGRVRSYRVVVPQASPLGGATMSPMQEIVFKNPIILRGTGDVLAINMAAATLAGNVASADIEWSEE